MLISAHGSSLSFICLIIQHTMYNIKIQVYLEFNKNIYKWRQRYFFVMIIVNRTKQKTLMTHLWPAQSQVEINHANLKLKLKELKQRTVYLSCPFLYINEEILSMFESFPFDFVQNKFCKTILFYYNKKFSTNHFCPPNFLVSGQSQLGVEPRVYTRFTQGLTKPISKINQLNLTKKRFNFREFR